MNFAAFDFEQNKTLPEYFLKGMLKKFDLHISDRTMILSNLSSRKVSKKVMRNKLYQQSEPTEIVLCLLEGSAKVYYELHNPYSSAIYGKPTSQHSSQLNSVKENQILKFAQIQAQFQMINEEVIVEYAQLHPNHNEKTAKEANDWPLTEEGKTGQVGVHLRGKQLSQNTLQRQQYSAVVSSSEIYYLQLTLEEANILLKGRMPLIFKKYEERLRLIEEKCSEFQEFKSVEKKSKMMSKLSLPNIALKNIHPANEIIQKSEKYKVYNKDLNVNANQESSEHKIEITDKFNSPDPRFEGMRTSRVIEELFITPKISKRYQKLVQSQKTSATRELPNKQFNAQFALFNQNQQILQRYRSRKALQQMDNAQKKAQSQKSFGNTTNNPFQASTSIILKSKKNQKIFKEHLKGIIKRKIKYQKSHGGILKAFLNDQQMNIPANRHNVHIQDRSESLRDNYQSVSQEPKQRTQRRSYKQEEIAHHQDRPKAFSKPIHSKSMKNIGNAKLNRVIFTDKAHSNVREKKDQSELKEVDSERYHQQRRVAQIKKMLLEKISRDEDDIDNYFRVK